MLARLQAGNAFGGTGYFAAPAPPVTGKATQTGFGLQQLHQAALRAPEAGGQCDADLSLWNPVAEHRLITIGRNDPKVEMCFDKPAPKSAEPVRPEGR